MYDSPFVAEGDTSDLDDFYKSWYLLYGTTDMREIWFNRVPNPTVVDIVLQVEEVLDLDLSTETLQLTAVLDIEWVDPRLDWSGIKTLLNTYTKD